MLEAAKGRLLHERFVLILKLAQERQYQFPILGGILEIGAEHVDH